MSKKGFFSNKLNLILVITLTVLLIGIGVVIFSLFNTNNGVQAIDLSNKTPSEIEIWAKSNGLKDKLTITYEYSETVAENTFISQNPKAGEIITDKLEVIFSKGKNPDYEVEVPTITKTTKLEDIEKWCVDNGFNDVTVEYENVEDVEKDIVIRLNVTGKVKRSQPIIIYVSSGGDLSKIEIEVIDFTGMTKEEVATWAKSHTATIEYTAEFSNTVESGKVISQTIAPKTKIKANKTIGVVISKGKGIEILDFPGDKKSTIQTWATKNNVKLEFIDEYSDTVKEGLCIKTEPSTGSFISEGDTLTVYMSKGPKASIVVPSDLVGKTESEFITTIKNLKLIPVKGSTTYFSKTITKGNIYSYDEGTFSEGDSINYTLSEGAYTFVASEYNGKTKSAAQSLVDSYNNRNAGIKITFNDNTASGYTIGTVHDCKSSGSNIVCELAVEATYPVNNYVGKDEPCSSDDECVVDNVRYKRSESQYSDTVVAGKVISQSKQSGSVSKNELITYVVSLGQKPVSKKHILPLTAYISGSKNYSTVDDTKNYMNKQLSGFTNISYSVEESTKSTGTIIKMVVGGNDKYEEGDYPIDTPIEITIAKQYN